MPHTQTTLSRVRAQPVFSSCSLVGLLTVSLLSKQTVTTSSTEAELLALTDAAKEMSSWRRFFQSISLDLIENQTIWCDNAQTIRLLAKESPKLVTRLRHIDINQH